MSTKPSNKSIRIVQYMHGKYDYFRWSERINEHYCRRHGYDYTIARNAPRDDRHIVWQKVPTILDQLHDCDYLLFMDADAVFYSQELRVEEELIPLLGDKSILMAQDVMSEQWRWHPGLPNTGVILMRVNDVVREYVDYWNKSSDIDPKTRWTWPPEQIALWEMVMPKYPNVLNVHDEYYLIQGRFGNYIRHFLMMEDKWRCHYMKELCQSRGIS